MSSVEFRPCDPEVAPASELLSEMRVELAELYADPARLDVPVLNPSDLRPPVGIYLVGFDGESAIAGGGVRGLSEGTAEIKRMFVRPVARSRGMAGLLLTALERQAAELGYGAVRLDTGPKQQHALRLYRSAGYQDIPPYNDNPFACFWGEKRLAG
ncbi:MAG TPA: GNAT family N-acetyltransferase [Acidimicrobiales bacterium]|jgi:GNAT superfamily N-acetyltransferase